MSGRCLGSSWIVWEYSARARFFRRAAMLLECHFLAQLTDATPQERKLQTVEDLTKLSNILATQREIMGSRISMCLYYVSLPRPAAHSLSPSIPRRCSPFRWSSNVPGRFSVTDRRGRRNSEIRYSDDSILSPVPFPHEIQVRSERLCLLGANVWDFGLGRPRFELRPMVAQNSVHHLELKFRIFVSSFVTYRSYP